MAPDLSRIAALAAALAAAGCAILPAETPAPAPAATSVSRSPAEAWAVLPADAGAVLSVVEDDRPRVRSQRIVLEGAGSLPGENAVTVRLPGRTGPGAGLLDRPTDTAIAAEMRQALRGVRMTVRPAPVPAASGPFGVALGAAGPFTCLYAWQHLEPDGIGDAGFGPADVRVRLCARRDAETLLGWLRAIRLAPPGATAPLAGAAAPIPAGADALAVATGTAAPR